MEEEIQQRFRKASLEQMQSCIPEVTSPEPLPKEITIVFRFGAELTSIVKRVQSDLQSVSPDLFYYPETQLHMTLIGKVPRTLGLEKILETVKEEIGNKKIRFNFFGTGMGKFSTSLSAYPIDFSLEQLRNGLRMKLGIKGSDFTIHLQDYEYVGWVNFVRNLDSVPNEAYRKKVLLYKDERFGEFSPEYIDILENESWVLDPANTKSLVHLVL